MIEVQRRYARRLTGHLVRVGCVNGTTLEGRLIGFNGRSLWLVAGGEDRFVDLADVVAMVEVSCP